MYIVERIESPADFAALAPAWDAVFDADPEAHFFLSREWIAQAFAVIGTNCCVLAVRSEEGAGGYQAFLPLRVNAYLSKSQQVFCNELIMPGLVNWADFTGFLCRPEDEAGVIAALAMHLRAMPWALLAMKNLLVSEHRLALFLEAFGQAQFEILQRPRGPNRDGIDNDACPRVQLPASFEGFLAEKASPNTRQKLRRLLRTVEGDGQWRITESDTSTFPRDIEVLLTFWKQAWAAHKGDDIERLTRYYRSILRNAFEAGLMYMPVLWQGDRPVGVLGHFVDRRKRAMLFKVAGRDPDCTEISPGLVLHAWSIRHAIAQGMEAYDFLRGNEAYKYSFGATDRRLVNLTIRTRSRRNAAEGLDPSGMGEVLEQCLRYQQLGQPEKAEIGYRQVLQQDPAQPVAAFLLESLHRQRRMSGSDNAD